MIKKSSHSKTLIPIINGKSGSRSKNNDIDSKKTGESL